MTLTDKMEELSIGFMKIVANSTGYFNMTGRDYSTDMHSRHTVKITNNYFID